MFVLCNAKKGPTESQNFRKENAEIKRRLKSGPVSSAERENQAIFSFLPFLLFPVDLTRRVA